MNISLGIKKESFLVNELIIQQLNSDVELIGTLAKHVILAGGKRIRSSLTILAAKICNYQGSQHINIATAVEFIHTATLLHDDVVDNNELRRGKKAANVLWGNQASILVGDFLLSRSFLLLTEIKNMVILATLSKAATIISEGEILQLANNDNLSMNEKTYDRIIHTKTAALTAAACSVGAIIAKADKKKQNALYNYGLNLGIFFQMIDDILDYKVNTKKWGKLSGNDLKGKVITLPIIHCYKNLAKKQQKQFEAIFNKQLIQVADFQQIQEFLTATKSLEYCLLQAEQYKQKAKKSLDVFEDCIAKQSLLHLADFCLARTY